jgi:hypothetical protein
MFANAICHVHVNLLKLQLMVTARVLVWHIQKGQHSNTVLNGLNVLGESQ